jgi:rhodanese-related sulfurtransferase
VLSVQALKEAWIDKDIPHVLLDVRPVKDSAKGFIKGAVTFPAIDTAKLISALPPRDKKPPVIIYDGKDGQQAVAVAKDLLKAGYGKVMVLTGGLDAWKSAGFEVASGTLTAKATYTPKPRPGELNLDVFKKYVAELPSNVMIVDVRTAGEAKSGMFKGAKLIPAEEIPERLAEIPKDKLIVTLCSTGVRGEMAYHALKALGYTNVAFVNAKIDFEKDGTYKISQN